MMELVYQVNYSALVISEAQLKTKNCYLFAGSYISAAIVLVLLVIDMPVELSWSKD